jgi:stage V sporulation protein S
MLGGIHCVPAKCGEEPTLELTVAANEGAIPVPEVLKVSADSKPQAVAGAIAAVFREKGSVELQAVGAGAVNQTVKAIAIARGFVAPNGIDLVAIPAFTKVEIEGEERTAIKFLVTAR